MQRLIQWDVSWIHSASIDDISYMPKSTISSVSRLRANNPPLYPPNMLRILVNRVPKLSCSCVAIRAHLLITSLHTTERGFTLPDSHLSSVMSDISLWFYWSVLHNSGHGFIITSLENSSTYNCSSGATTRRIMLPLFSVRIPVPALFFVGQSKQCDTAMGGCSHYLC